MKRITNLTQILCQNVTKYGVSSSTHLYKSGKIRLRMRKKDSIYAKFLKIFWRNIPPDPLAQLSRLTYDL